MDLKLRPATSDDMGFLFQVYASTRVEELAPLPWTDEQRMAFLQMQFGAQDTYYHDNFKEAAFQVVELDGQPIGRLYEEQRSDEYALLDIALLPEFRGRGIGTELMKGVLTTAARVGLPVRLYVEFNNPAHRLYERFGFYKIGEHGVYMHMEALPVQQHIR